MRGKHDQWNGTLSGFFTGGALAIRSGPTGALLGAAGFGAFSYVIDKMMVRWEEPNDPKAARKDRMDQLEIEDEVPEPLHVLQKQYMDRLAALMRKQELERSR